MSFEGKNVKVNCESSTRNYTEREDFIRACKELVQLNPGMLEFVEYAKNSKPMKIADVYNYIRMAQKGNTSARDVIIGAYMPHALIQTLYYSKLLEAIDIMEDIYQECLLAIQSMIMDFDFNGESKISALLASKFQRAAIITAICNHNKKYTIPINIAQNLLTLKRYLAKNGYTTDDQDVIIGFCKRKWGCSNKESMRFYMLLQEPETLENIDEKISRNKSYAYCKRTGCKLNLHYAA